MRFLTICRRTSIEQHASALVSGLGYARAKSALTSHITNALRSSIGMPLAVVLGALALTALAAEPKPSDALASLSTTRNTYLVVYRRGPDWVDDKPMREQQSMREHFLYYLGLHRKGLLIAGGGFTDESGGAAVFEADNDAAATEIVAADPAVKSKVFRFELQHWKPNPWEEISQKRAARGE
jgi:uncharacterized protein YciI